MGRDGKHRFNCTIEGSNGVSMFGLSVVAVVFMENKHERRRFDYDTKIRIAFEYSFKSGFSDKIREQVQKAPFKIIIPRY